MRLKDIVRARKVITDAGKPSNGKMPKSAFPLSKSGSYRLGAGWLWQVVGFQAHCKDAIVNCRMLAAVHVGKQNYEGWLAVERDQDLVLLARYEYHSEHNPHGWHLHSKCVDIASLTPGVVKGPYVKRYPETKAKHRRQSFYITETDFLGPAYTVFGMDRQ
jgi:hypothetical protein